jgi:hypothetical protein
MDDTIRTAGTFCKIHTPQRKKFHFVNFANPSFVECPINHSEFQNQNIKEYHERNCLLMIPNGWSILRRDDSSTEMFRSHRSLNPGFSPCSPH